MRRRISPAMRRHLDYLRLKALRVAQAYESRLKRLRRAEVRRVLGLCKDYDPSEWAGVIDTNLSEPYLQQIERGLILSVGLPHAQSVVRDMNRKKAEDSEVLKSMWMSSLEQYANERVGDLIVSVSGTLKEELIKILRAKMADGVTGIEKVTLEVYKEYNELALWQGRRRGRAHPRRQVHQAMEYQRTGQFEGDAHRGGRNGRRARRAVQGRPKLPHVSARHEYGRRSWRDN